MTECDVGDLVLVPFPFLNLKTKKRRPALILSVIQPKELPRFSVIAMVTSQIRGESFPGDYLIQDWKEANLLHSSKARLAKIVSVENHLFLKKIGRLSPRDLKGCHEAFGEVFPQLLA